MLYIFEGQAFVNKFDAYLALVQLLYQLTATCKSVGARNLKTDRYHFLLLDKQ